MKVKISDVYCWIYIVIVIAFALISILTDKEGRDLLIRITFVFLDLLSIFGWIIINAQQEKIEDLKQVITELEIKNQFNKEVIEIYENDKK